MDKSKIIVIGSGGGEIGLAAVASLLAEKTQIDVVELMDDMELVSGRYAQPIELAIHPQFSIFGEERKRKKPCTFHEYVLKERKEEKRGMGTIIIEVWKCRHCEHPLK